MSADTLSDVLRTVRMTGAVFFNVTGKEPWVAEQPTREIVLPILQPGAQHMMAYHIATKGSCYACVIDGETVKLNEGQVVVFTRGDPHVMSSSPGMRAEPVGPIPANVNLPIRVSYGDQGSSDTRLVCGFLAYDKSLFNPLIENLPNVLVGDSRRGAMPWLEKLVQVAMNEADEKRTGSEIILGKLTELMFIEVVRQYVDRLLPDQSGWLAGLRDPIVGRALSLMHGDPARDWDVGCLSKAAGASRSEFSERFAMFVGIPPMQYLARWRMQLASEMLADDVNVGAVAGRVGYGSEASFSRAFKKMVGVPPSVWRCRRTTA